MEPVRYGRALRQRWGLVLACTVFGAAVALLAPPAVGTTSAPSRRLEDYTSSAHSRYASVAVIGTPPSSGTVSSPLLGRTDTRYATLLFYLSDNRVMKDFTRRIGYHGDDPTLPSRVVVAKADPQTGTVTLTGYGGTPREATANVEAFIASAQALFTKMRTTAGTDTLREARARIRSLSARLHHLSKNIRKIRDKSGLASPNPLSSEQAALLAKYRTTLGSYGAAYDALVQLQHPSASGVADFVVLHPPRANQATEVPPSLLYSATFRVVIGLIAGFLLGVALALLLAHFSRRITSRERLERVLGVPVLAEIPRRARPLVALFRLRRSRQLSRAFESLALLLLDALPLRPSEAVSLENDEVIASTRVVGGPASVPARVLGSSERSPRPCLLVFTRPAGEPVYDSVIVGATKALAAVAGPVTLLRRGRDGTSSAGHHHAPHVQPSGQSAPTPVGPVVTIVELSAGGADVASADVGASPLAVVNAGDASSPELIGAARSADAVVMICQYGRTRVDDAERAAELVRLAGGTPIGAVLAEVPSYALRQPVRRRWPRIRGSSLRRRRA